jgi:ADP-L-glycero-D-manno-heptose 6-epimerase
MRCFVTGGTGFIGFNLVKKLKENGHEVAISTITTSENPALAPVLGSTLRLIKDEAFSYNDVVFHYAANNTTQDKNESEMMEANFHAPVDLFRKFADKGCRRFIYASSAAVYGNSPAPFNESSTPLNPLTPYAKSKIEFDQWAMDFASDRKISVVGLRLANVYGPGESHKKSRASMIYTMMFRVARGERPNLFWDGSQQRDWVYIKDVVQANLAAMKYKNGSLIANIGSGQSWSFNDILKRVNKNANERYPAYFIPNPYFETYQDHTECDISLAVKELDYKPEYDLVDGIADYLKSWS